jgi:fluoroacetyl-CoA thioesterase
MKPTLAVGETYELTYVVPEAKTVPHLFEESPLIRSMPAVLATPNMIALMEWACTELLARHYDAGEGSVGVHVDVAHLGATMAGQTVRVTAEVRGIENRKVTFHVVAHDDLDKIGEGRHVRMLVPWDKFNARLGEKARTLAARKG